MKDLPQWPSSSESFPEFSFTKVVDPEDQLNRELLEVKVHLQELFRVPGAELYRVSDGAKFNGLMAVSVQEKPEGDAKLNDVYGTLVTLGNGGRLSGLTSFAGVVSGGYGLKVVHQDTIAFYQKQGLGRARILAIQKMLSSGMLGFQANLASDGSFSKDSPRPYGEEVWLRLKEQNVAEDDPKRPGAYRFISPNG